MLAQLKFEAGAQLRTKGGKRVVCGHARIGEAYLHIRAPLETLRIRKICGAGILNRAGRITKSTRAGGSSMVNLQGSADNGIKTTNDRPQASRGVHNSRGAGSNPPGCRRCSTWT